jgi:hypothetical protein
VPFIPIDSLLRESSAVTRTKGGAASGLLRDCKTYVEANAVLASTVSGFHWTAAKLRQIAKETGSETLPTTLEPLFKV